MSEKPDTNTTSGDPSDCERQVVRPNLEKLIQDLFAQVEELKDDIERNPDFDNDGYQHHDPFQRSLRMMLFYRAAHELEKALKDVRRMDAIDREAYYDENGETGWNIPRTSGGCVRESVDLHFS